MKKIHSRGYTLIELLIVIAIIGILATVGLVTLQGARESARDAKRMSDLSQMRLGLALYFEDHDGYPAPVASSGEGPDLSTTTADGTVFSQNNNPLFPGYISRMFVDPVNSGSYHYYYDTNQSIDHRNYVFCFHQESNDGNYFFFYSTGVYGEGGEYPSLP